MTKMEARAKLQERVEEVQDEAEVYEPYHVEWADDIGIVRLVWNSPLIEDTELEYDVPFDD